MTSLIPVAINSSRTLAYRTIEIEQAMKRNMLVALAISIVIHALVVACYYLAPLPAIDMTKTLFKPPGERPWTSKPIDFEQYEIPNAFSGVVPNVANIQAGKVVVVPDALADPKLTLASQKDLKNGVTLGSTEGSEGTGVPGIFDGNGEKPFDGEIEDPEPPVFRVVEHDPVLVRSIPPKYPELLAKSGIEGKVWIKIWVDKQGKPHEVRLMKSDNEMLNEAAIEAAKQFLFTPAYMNNGPVSVWVSVPFSFKLR
jgi:TonB family protein